MEHSTDRVPTLSSLEQVQDYVKKENKLKVLGTGHFFNNIAASKDLLPIAEADGQSDRDRSMKRTLTVAAGITCGQLCPYLDGKGFALHNLASLPHISMADALSMATDGSGSKKRKPGNGSIRTGNRDSGRQCCESVRSGPAEDQSGCLYSSGDQDRSGITKL